MVYFLDLEGPFTGNTFVESYLHTGRMILWNKTHISEVMPLMNSSVLVLLIEFEIVRAIYLFHACQQ